MKILIVGSGSGGHIYPAIAFSKYLKSINVDYFILAFKKIDKEIYDKNKINYFYIDNDLSFIKKSKEISKIIKKNNIDKFISFGGKNGFIAGINAFVNNVSIYISEQNVVLGKANKILSLFAKKIFLSFPIKENEKYVLVGNPVVDLLKNKKKSFFKNNQPIILFVCGSLGSNTIMEKINSFIHENAMFNYIIVKGKNIKMNILEKENIKVFSYYEPLSELIYNSNLIVSRAGATTMAEIINLKKPSILIPSPYVTNNHQYKNAKFLYDINATVLIEEKNLNNDSLKKNINKILFSPFESKRIENSLKNIVKDNVCQNLYEEIRK